ncbi:MAG: class I mannose-6-phosphate isomerase [Bacteroidales bacterium]|nr:class I mannose-6-phosphate isomerase [Bacteroidales bacterium]
MEKRRLYPLKFHPSIKHKVWGGDAITKKLGKEEITDDSNDHGQEESANVGESWEIYHLYDASSVVAEGFLAENELADLLETYMEELVGENIFNWYQNQFPLVIKFLDITDKLSVQVHPTDEIAMQQYDSYGKREFWYVMDAGPDAFVYLGFKRDVTAQEFYDCCTGGTLDSIMNCFHPKKGDCYLIEPGTVHSAGGGVLLLETQTASDITFRIYDWGREKNPATRRAMHLQEAMECINFEKLDIGRCVKSTAATSGELENNRSFTINKLLLTENYFVDNSSQGSFTIFVAIAGSAALQYEDKVYELNYGETILVPATAEKYIIAPREKGTELLEIFINDIPEEEDSYLQ